MSDTPLTDAVEAKLHDPLYPTTALNNLHTMANHARTLEQRNAELVEALRHYRGYASSISGMMGNMINTPTADRLRFVEQELNYIAAHSQEVFEDLGKAEDEEYAALDRNGGGK